MLSVEYDCESDNSSYINYWTFISFAIRTTTANFSKVYFIIIKAAHLC